MRFESGMSNRRKLERRMQRLNLWVIAAIGDYSVFLRILYQWRMLFPRCNSIWELTAVDGALV